MLNCSSRRGENDDKTQKKFVTKITERETKNKRLEYFYCLRLAKAASMNAAKNVFFKLNFFAAFGFRTSGLGMGKSAMSLPAHNAKPGRHSAKKNNKRHYRILFR